MKNTLTVLITSLIILIFVGGFFGTLYVLNNYIYTKTPLNPSFDLSTEGYTEVDVEIIDSSLQFYTDCYSLIMGISEIQAFSIQNGLNDKIDVRPLTHDIMNDVLDNFDLDVLMVRVESFNDGIYYAKIFMKKDNRLLELDSRPSDAVGLAVRTNSKIYSIIF